LCAVQRWSRVALLRRQVSGRRDSSMACG
jgi:hypothetical protein